MKIVYDDFNHNFIGYVDGRKVCELNLFEENEDCDEEFYKEPKYWLNGIYTIKEHCRNGYATQLIKKAIDKYRVVYVSTATDYEHKQRGDNSARELTIEGALLTNKLKEKNILKSEWFINPFL
jgi:GNAT superfamily N-acetyltransferase